MTIRTAYRQNRSYPARELVCLDHPHPVFLYVVSHETLRRVVDLRLIEREEQFRIDRHVREAHS